MDALLDKSFRTGTGDKGSQNVDHPVQPAQNTRVNHMIGDLYGM